MRGKGSDKALFSIFAGGQSEGERGSRGNKKKIASTRSHEVYLLLQRDIPSYAKFDRFLLAIQYINVIN